MEKKNNGLVIILMGIIIVILIALCILFATNTITFNHKEIKNEIENQKNTNELNNEESILSEEQAKTVLKNIVENSTVRHIYDNPGLTYCNNSEEKQYSEEELGLNYNWSYFQKCNDYNSYDELVKYFKNYFTEEYYKNNLENKYSVTTKSKIVGGIETYFYLEKDGNLYVAYTLKGTNMSKNKISNTNYVITLIEKNKIDGMVMINWLDVDDEASETENIDVELIKENGNWKINKYDLK